MLVLVMVDGFDYLLLLYRSNLLQLQLVLLVHILISWVGMKYIMRVVRMIIRYGSGFQHLDVFLCADGSAYSTQELGKLAVSPLSHDFIQFDHLEFIQPERARLVESSIGIPNLTKHMGLCYRS